MLKRRTMIGLLGAGAAAIGAPVLASAVFSGADAADGLPITVVNSTGTFPNTAISMYVVGTDPAGNQGYVKGNGVFVPVNAGSTGPDGALDIAVPLAQNGVTSLILPKMSGRVYFAINGRLQFKAVVDGNGKGALQYPVGWVEGDPAYGVLHDWIEFTYNDGGMYCNTTMVDMFGIPFALRLKGAGESTAGKLVDGGRDAIFTAMANQPGFDQLVVGDRLRIIAPGHGIETGRFSPTYYDRYIDEIWDRYSRTTLRVATGNGTHTGRVNQTGQLAFEYGGAFSRPTTKDVFYCDGALSAPNDGVTGPVAAVLGAGFNRSVLDQSDQPVSNPVAFYQNPITNHYSRILHHSTADGRAYGFPFDDVAGGAAYIQDVKPTGLQITLTPFGAGTSGDNGNPPPPAPLKKAVIVVPAAPASRKDDGRRPANGASAYGQIPADSFSAQRGVTTEPSTEGGRDIGCVANGDWVRYSNVDFGDQAPATQFLVRAASGAPAGVSGLVEVRIGSRGSAPVGTIAVANTGGWQAWRTIPGNMAPVSGVHDVYLTFTSGQPLEYINVRWLSFGH